MFFGKKILISCKAFVRQSGSRIAKKISENEQLAIALRQLVEHKRKVIRKREKEAEIKKNQGLAFQFK